MERPPHLVQRPLALMERADDGQQHIGIVFNGIEVKMILVIIVGADVYKRQALYFALLKRNSASAVMWSQP